MKKLNLMLFATILAMAFASCGGEEKSETLEASKTTSTTESIASDNEDHGSYYDDEDHGSYYDDEEESTSSEGGEDWEEFLDGYEAYVDKYITILKKMKADPSDMSIMTEYQELLDNGTEWATKMENSSAEFGIEQLNRMQKIQEKLNKAASGI